MTDEAARVDVNGVSMVYHLDEIARVDLKSNPSPIQENISAKEVDDLYQHITAKKRAVTVNRSTQKEEPTTTIKEETGEYRPTYFAELYKPLVPKKRFLSDTEFYYFNKHSYGNHGYTLYDRISNDSHFYSLKESVKFSPLSNLEMELGYKRVLPSSFKRVVYESWSDTARGTSDCSIIYLDDYTFKTRSRFDNFEFYLDVLEKRQKSQRDYRVYSDHYSHFYHYYTNYEDIKAGVRYVSEPGVVVDESNLSKITRPLLSARQLNAETELEFKQGKARRSIEYDSASLRDASTYYTFSHYIPKVTLRYGLSKDLEGEAGLYYVTPYAYKYVYTINYADETYIYFDTAYRLKNNFIFPLGLRFRPQDNVELSFLSDFNYAQQKIDHSSRAADGTVTDYPDKKLTYFNADPILRFTYLNDRGKTIQKDEFFSLTRTLLLKNQYKVDLEVKKDITHLNKGSTGGTQNIVDPYNVFMWPVDEVVADTEYATMYAGNSLNYTTNISPQNYYQLKGTIAYGFTDVLNAGLTLGYHSSSSLHFYSIPDFYNRFYKFKPYYFIDPFLDWRVTKNSMFSLKSHFVPQYTVLSDYNDPTGPYPKVFKGESLYYDLTARYEILF